MKCEDLAYRLPLLMNECVYALPEFLSFLFGYASIGCWIFAQMPQLYKNFKNKQYINIKFILIWLMGDICNLLGSKLTNQKPFQVYLATYFVMIDTLLLSQCVYYRSFEEQLNIGSLASPSALSPLLLASPAHAFQGKESLGNLISWICCILYLTSRIPQLFSNFQRKSVQSLSMEMFACALLGNATYSISLLLSWNPNCVPFLLGSLGTIGLDIFVFVQYFMYRERHEGHVD